MIMSALIAQCRREFYDPVKSSYAAKFGDAQSTLFNIGRFPIIENSYVVKLSGATQTEGTKYSLNKDNGDITWLSAAPPTTKQATINFQYANWRDLNWVEAVNQAISNLNGRGFFRETARASGLMGLSAGIQKYNAPSACIDLFEVLEPATNSSVSGIFGVTKIRTNWRYDQDANVLIIGNKPSIGIPLTISYLRQMQTYQATSATLDVRDEWIEPVKKKAGAIYMRFMASKIAQQGNANIDEGHFSFTSLRTNAVDLDNEFDKFAKQKKPTRPAKDMQWKMEQGGDA